MTRLLVGLLLSLNSWVEEMEDECLAETVTEQAKEFCERVTSRATAFASFLVGGE